MGKSLVMVHKLKYPTFRMNFKNGSVILNKDIKRFLTEEQFKNLETTVINGNKESMSFMMEQEQILELLNALIE